MFGAQRREPRFAFERHGIGNEPPARLQRAPRRFKHACIANAAADEHCIGRSKPGQRLRRMTMYDFEIGRPEDLGPLRHVLALVDGAAVFDGSGTLVHLGVRLVPSAEAESDVEGYRGMRHTSARRYSFDDPTATLIVVSEDGPVSVIRNGEVLGRPLERRPAP